MTKFRCEFGVSPFCNCHMLHKAE